MLRSRPQNIRGQLPLPQATATVTALESFRIQWNAEIAASHPGRPRNTPLPGQSSIIRALNGGVALRPARPGPVPQSRPLPVLLIQRQMVGGPQESSVVALFDSVHSQQSAGFDEEGELTVSPPRK